jgi:anti-sigma factor RsiW
MNCQACQELLHAYIDNELDLVRHLEMETHLAECATCGRACEQQQTLRSALGSPALRFEAPPGLRQRVRSALRQADRSLPALPTTLWPRLRAVAALVLVALGTGIVVRLASVPASEEPLAQGVFTAHARSLQADLTGHLTDIPSTDQHVVKPWFDGKVDYAVWVQDLKEHGYPLVGGRLDYLNDRPVAALVYQRRKHRINLFQWPAARQADTEPRLVRHRNYRLYHWVKGGMTYQVVSDLNDGELQAFVELVRTNS